MITMSSGPAVAPARPRAAPARPFTEPATEPVPETAPLMQSPRLASLLDTVENAERIKREQEALALLGRLAAFD